jgi:hypothetical protein
VNLFGFFLLEPGALRSLSALLQELQGGELLHVLHLRSGVNLASSGTWLVAGEHASRGGSVWVAGVLGECALSVGLVGVGDLEALVQQRVSVEVLDGVRRAERVAVLDKAVALGCACLAVVDDLDGLRWSVHLEDLAQLRLIDGGWDVVDHQVAQGLWLGRLWGSWVWLRVLHFVEVLGVSQFFCF